MELSGLWLFITVCELRVGNETDVRYFGSIALLIAELLMLLNCHFLPMGLKIFRSAYLSRASTPCFLVPIAQ